MTLRVMSALILHAMKQLILPQISQLANTPAIRQYHVWRGGRPLRRQTTRAVMAVGDSAAPQPPNRLRSAEINQHRPVYGNTCREVGRDSKNKTDSLYFSTYSSPRCENKYSPICSSLCVEQAETYKNGKYL